uniref:Uncharacterized protein n=1 Tax=Romanomermis culicivorax TaxID=13658 RepID=A0A915IM10_ROMCU
MNNRIYRLCRKQKAM